MNFRSSIYSPNYQPNYNQDNGLNTNNNLPSPPVYTSTFTFGGYNSPANSYPNAPANSYPNAPSLYYNNAYNRARNLTQMLPEDLYKILLYFFIIIIFGGILIKLTNMGMFNDKDTKYGKWCYFLYLLIFILFVILPIYRNSNNQKKKKN